ncbi:MAG: hypothetical protein RJA57_675 [Bacteroidota bacterium]
MNKILIAAAFGLLLLAACQKEIDWGTNAGATPDRLYRTRSQTGTDTSQTDYSYDANGRLVRIKTAGMSGGQDLSNELTITRDAAGIILSTTQKAAALLMAGIDSLVIRYNYNTATTRYTSSVFNLNIPGFNVKDSTLYSYDAAGRISKDEHYLQVSGLPIPLPPILALRNTYYYSSSGANIDSVLRETTANPGDPLTPTASQSYTYDTKVNPLILTKEAVLLNQVDLYNANNPTRSRTRTFTGPGADVVTDYTYRYNAINKPDSSYGIPTPGGDTTRTKFFYQ